MNPDPQVRILLEQAAARVHVDTEAALEDVRRRGRRRRNRQIAVRVLAAALTLAALAAVVYRSSDDRGYLRPADRPTGRLAFGSRPTVGASGADKLVEVDLASGIRRVLTSGPSVVTAAQWSPDGSHIAYTVEEGGGEHYAVVVARADGSEPVRILEHPKGDPTLPGPDLISVAWSPDGSQLAFSGRTIFRGRTVSVMRADGSDLRVLDGHWENVSWSPDGQRLLLLGWPDDTGARRFDLYLMRPNGTALTQLTFDDATEFQASWSPDGSRIAFARSDTAGDGKNLDVFVMDADGSNLRRLTGPGSFDAVPVWSPDGRWIVFASDRSTTPAERAAGGDEGVGPTSIYAMRPDGSEVALLLQSSGEVLFPLSWAW